MSTSKPRNDLQTVLAALGLPARICVDAGDEASYTTGQTWNDRAGSGLGFFLGTTASVAADDPTFTGVAGRRSDGDYFSFDGADTFLLPTPLPAWLQNFHKDNGRWTVACMAQLSAVNAIAYLISDMDNANGFRVFCSAAGKFVVHARQNSVDVTVYTSTASIPANVPVFFAASFDDVTAQGLIAINDVRETFAPLLGATSADTANGVRMGSVLGSGFLPNGSRMWSAAFWDYALPLSDINAVHQAVRGKFGA